MELSKGRGFDNNTKYWPRHKAVVWSYISYWQEYKDDTDSQKLPVSFL